MADLAEEERVWFSLQLRNDGYYTMVKDLSTDKLQAYVIRGLMHAHQLSDRADRRMTLSPNQLRWFSGKIKTHSVELHPSSDGELLQWVEKNYHQETDPVSQIIDSLSLTDPQKEWFITNADRHKPTIQQMNPTDLGSWIRQKYGEVQQGRVIQLVQIFTPFQPIHSHRDPVNFMNK